MGEYEFSTLFKISMEMTNLNPAQIMELFECVWRASITDAIIDMFGNVSSVSDFAIAEDYLLRTGTYVDERLIHAFREAIADIVGMYDKIENEVVFLGWSQINQPHFLRFTGFVL
jgi:hypothetical protein